MNPGPDSNRHSAAALTLAAALLLPDSALSRPDRPVTVEAAYTGEVWHNLDGGIERGSAYLDNVRVAVELDADAPWDWSGTRLLLEGLYNNGNPLSPRLTGDLQTVSNIEAGPNELRVYQALLSTDFGAGGSLRVGLYDLNSEFDVLASSALFLHSAHGIGTDIGQTGVNGPSIFPLTSLGLRLAWRWNDSWQARAALLDGVPGQRDKPNEMDVDLGGGDGALLAMELGRRTPTTTLLVGAWGYTAAFPIWPEPAGEADRAHGNRGWYVRGEWQASEAVGVFARVGRARARFNVFDGFASAGVRWLAPLASRPGDELGFAVAWAEGSSTYRSSERLQGRDTESREVALELTYRLPVAERVALQPDLQYIIHPGLDADLDDSLVLGLRLDVTLH